MMRSFLFVLAIACANCLAAEVVFGNLAIGQPIRRATSRSESHRYHFSLGAGRCQAVHLRQTNIDVWLKIYSPLEELVVDLNWDPWGEERYWVCSERGGRYLLTVQASAEGSERGSYVVLLPQNFSPRSEGTGADVMAVQWDVAKAIQARTDSQTLENALAIYQRRGDTWAEMKVLSHLARAYHRKGEYGSTVKEQRRALSLARQLRDRTEEAISLRELARVYGHIDDHSRRSAALRDATTLMLTLDDARIKAAVLDTLAGSLAEVGKFKQSVQQYRHIIDMHRQIGDMDGVRRGRYSIASLLLEMRQPQLALEEASSYLVAQKATGRPPGQASAYSLIGRAYQHCKLLSEAAKHLRTAAAIQRMIGDKSAEAAVNGVLAEVEYSRGDYRAALRYTDWGIRLWDDIRASAGSAKWQAGLEWANVERSKVRILMALHQLDPTQTYDQQSLLTADGMRARYLTEADATIDEIQSLVDQSTVLLQYLIAPQRSFLWVLDGTAVRSFLLPGDETFKPLLDRYEKAVLTRNQQSSLETRKQRASRIAKADKDLADLGVQLSKILFSQIAGFIGVKKLLIVPDGQLQSLPFAALPDPTHPGGRLVGEVREVAYLPSATTVLAARRKREERVPPTSELAIVADPVFRNGDPRVRAGGNGIEMPRALQAATRALGLKAIPRLLYSRLEAQTIASFARNPLVLLDFDASRDAFLANRLNNFRILHFAAHGFSNLEDPELSGLVLSLVDREGLAKDGFLRFKDVYGRKINADLVVLSACQTAVGKSFAETGMMTLAGAFLHAGAARVLSTLWKIDDEATAAFMKIYYRELLANAQSPTQALRNAQIELARIPRWKSPYYWAAFVLQGWPH